MRTLPFHCDRTSFFAAIVLVTWCVVPSDPEGVALAQSPAAASKSPELVHTLQDIKLVGPLAIEGEVVPPDDVLTFKDGMFSSRTCRRFGFAPAPYWVRRDSDGLHFRATLQSPESGTIRFDGVFDGKQMRATAQWTKERWYWTVEQTIRFTGRIAGQL